MALSILEASDSTFFAISALLIEGLRKISTLLRRILSTLSVFFPTFSLSTSSSSGGYWVNKSCKTTFAPSENVKWVRLLGPFLAATCFLGLKTDTRRWPPCLHKVQVQKKAYQNKRTQAKSKYRKNAFFIRNTKLPKSLVAQVAPPNVSNGEFKVQIPPPPHCNYWKNVQSWISSSR